MTKRRILVIEDDAAIRQGVLDSLEFAGFETHEAADGKAGLESAIKIDCDLVLLDLVLPHVDGLDILREVRATRPTLPVIIMTARGAEEERVEGLRLGADDYVVKPFSVKELLARVGAVLRRSAERPSDIQSVNVPDGVADFARCEVRFSNGDRTELSQREMEVLRYLACNAGRAVSRDEILSRVWRINPRGIVETRTTDMLVTRLRKKIRDDSANPQVIRTVRGQGYMFAAVESLK